MRSMTSGDISVLPTQIRKCSLEIVIYQTIADLEEQSETRSVKERIEKVLAFLLDFGFIIYCDKKII